MENIKQIMAAILKSQISVKKTILLKTKNYLDVNDIIVIQTEIEELEFQLKLL